MTAIQEFIMTCFQEVADSYTSDADLQLWLDSFLNDNRDCVPFEKALTYAKDIIDVYLPTDTMFKKAVLDCLDVDQLCLDMYTYIEDDIANRDPDEGFTENWGFSKAEYDTYKTNWETNKHHPGVTPLMNLDEFIEHRQLLCRQQAHAMSC
jgi:hypothetical protein